MEPFLLRILILLLSGICLLALDAVLHVLFPAWILRTQQTAEEHPGRSFLIGLVNLLFFASIAIGFSVLGDRVSGIFFAPAVLFAAPLVLGVVFGITGLVGLVGERLFGSLSGVRQRLAATGTLYLACLTPIVGWFGLTIYLSVYGLGAFLLGFFRRARSQEDEQTDGID